MHSFANPAKFERTADRILPWAIGIFALSLIAGLTLGLGFSPADYQQGETVRIMYIHVPSAWMCMFAYAFIAGASIVSLIWKHPLADLSARAAAPIGLGFTIIALATGSLWGKPMWGAWWVWDARLTSVLILAFIYLGYIALWQSVDDPRRAGKLAAILALVGAVNLPIIKFSVDWWNTLHQPASVIRADGPTIHPSMLTPLLIMVVAWQAYFAMVVLWRIKAEVARAKLTAMRTSADPAPMIAEAAE